MAYEWGVISGSNARVQEMIDEYVRLAIHCKDDVNTSDTKDCSEIVSDTIEENLWNTEDMLSILVACPNVDLFSNEIFLPAKEWFSQEVLKRVQEEQRLAL